MASFSKFVSPPSFSFGSVGWRPGRFRTPLPGPGWALLGELLPAGLLPAGGSLSLRLVRPGNRPHGGALGCPSALYGSSFRPGSGSGQGLVSRAMVGQRLGRWRGEAWRREAGVVVRRGLRRRAAAVARSSLRPWSSRGCSGAGNGGLSGLLASRALGSGSASSGAEAVRVSYAAPGSPSLLTSPSSLPSPLPLASVQSLLLARVHSDQPWPSSP